jgi:ferredoxin
MSDLKPCPWCKKDVSIISVEDSTYYWCITCEDCDFSWFVLGTRKEVIEKWNTRPAEDAKDKEIEQLKEALKKCRVLAIHINPRGIDKLKVIYEWMEEIERVADEALGKDNNVPTNAPDTNVGTMEG